MGESARPRVAIRLLGAVEAELGGQPVDLGPAPQRCGLVALLLDINPVVPAEHLLDGVWGDARPYRAHGPLYSYLSRLRAALTGTDQVGIAHQSGGYLLTADPDIVDLHLFRRLVTDA